MIYVLMIPLLILNVPRTYAQPVSTQDQQLTTDSSYDFYPAWSPNGTKIFFASNRSMGDWLIWSMNADGTAQTQITFPPGWDFCPAWSPDGTRIAYLSNRRDSTLLDIWVMNSNGSGQRILYLTVSSMPENSPPLPWSLPSWSPDGKSLAFARWVREDQRYSIWIVGADGKDLRRLTKFSSVYAAWSPNGTKVAFQSDRSGNWDIWVISSDGSNLLQLTQDLAEDIQPTWSPDGTKIAFESNRSGSTEIWVMDSDGSNPKQLTHLPMSTQFYPSWNPDGTKLAFASTQGGNWDVWATTLMYPSGASSSTTGTEQNLSRTLSETITPSATASSTQTFALDPQTLSLLGLFATVAVGVLVPTLWGINRAGKSLRDSCKVAILLALAADSVLYTIVGPLSQFTIPIFRGLPYVSPLWALPAIVLVIVCLVCIYRIMRPKRSLPRRPLDPILAVSLRSLRSSLSDFPQFEEALISYATLQNKGYERILETRGSKLPNAMASLKTKYFELTKPVGGQLDPAEWNLKKQRAITTPEFIELVNRAKDEIDKELEESNG